MFVELILALSLGSVAHSLKAYDDICPLLAGVPWVQSPDRPNEEGLWFPIAAHENPIISPSGLTCPKQSYIRVNASYLYEQVANEGGASGSIALEDSVVGLVGELAVGPNLFRIQCVDINYTSWAVLYICGNEVGENLDFEIFLVVSRTRTLDAGSLAFAKDVISKFGGDPSSLIQYKQSGCE